jgi:hypothetical protein
MESWNFPKAVERQTKKAVSVMPEMERICNLPRRWTSGLQIHPRTKRDRRTERRRLFHLWTEETDASVPGNGAAALPPRNFF